MNRLNQQIAQLGELNRHRSSTNFTNNHIQSHAMTVVAAFQTRLALDIRTENLKASKIRKDNFQRPTPNLHGGAPKGIGHCSVLFRDEQFAIQQPISSSSSATKYQQMQRTTCYLYPHGGAMLRSTPIREVALMEKT